MALVSLPCENFKKFQSEDNAHSITDCAIKTKIFALVLLNKCGIKPDEYEKTVATMINNAAVNAWVNTIKPEYSKDNDGYPTHFAFSRLIEKAGFCSYLIKAAIDFAENDELNDSSRYENLIEINDFCIEACSWKKVYLEYSSYWAKEYTLTASAINSRRDENAKFRDKAKSCKERGQKRRREELEKKAQEQKQRNETYWSEHAEEKQQLESELENLQTGLKELETQLAPFEKEIEALKDRREGEVPSEKEKDTVLAEISRIRQEQGKLGLFKGKEKKALQAQIDELNGRLSTINESIESERKEQQKECNEKIREVEERAKPIRDKIVATQKRINEIKAELTKNR